MTHAVFFVALFLGCLCAAFAQTCPSNCNGASHGLCVGGSCQCNLQWHGMDCAIPSSGSQCQINDAFCYSFAISDGQLFFHMDCKTAGWCGNTYGTKEGMTPASGNKYGDAWIARIDTKAVPPLVYIEDRYSTALGAAPALDAVQNLKLLFGVRNATHSSVAFSRPLNTGDEQDLTLINEEVVVGWAVSADPSFTDEHGSMGVSHVNFFTGAISTVPSLDEVSILWVLGGLAVIAVGGVVLQSNLVRRTAVGHFLLQTRLMRAQSKSLKPGELAWNATFFRSLMSVLEMSYEQVLACIVFIATMIVYAYAWMRDADDALVKTKYVWGHLAVVLLAVTLLPMTKNSIWVRLCGISYERCIKFHRWLGRVVVIIACIHAAVMDDLGVLKGYFNFDSTKNGSGNGYGSLAVIFLLAMLLTSLEFVRRTNNEFFKYCHFLFFPTVLVFAGLHYNPIFYSLALPLALYVIDRLLRAKASFSTHMVSAVATAHSEVAVTILRFKSYPLSKPVTGGQFVFVNVPAISKLQWHPFSVSSVSKNADGSSLISLHIMAMGYGSWTGQLHNLVLTAPDGINEIGIKVDGPYGHMCLELPDYQAVILCAGGVGVTPLMTIALDACLNATNSTQEIHFLWTCRDEVFFEWYPDELVKILANPRITLHLYKSGEKGGFQTNAASFSMAYPIELGDVEVETEKVSVALVAKNKNFQRAVECKAAIEKAGVQVKLGQPDVAALFAELKNKLCTSGKDGKNVAVVACGPPGLVTFCQQEATRQQFDFHRETFIL